MGIKITEAIKTTTDNSTGQYCIMNKKDQMKNIHEHMETKALNAYLNHERNFSIKILAVCKMESCFFVGSEPILHWRPLSLRGKLA